ncbi:MAG: hypothetical protein WCO00_14495 [Rhodospirillaceae bacterium]
MTIRVSQPPDAGPGRARLEVTPRRGLEPAQLEFALENNQGRCLQPAEGGGTDWGTTPSWLPPAEAAISGDGLAFLLDTRTTWNLKAGVTYRLKLRNRDGSGSLEDRMAWPGIQMPATSAPVGIAAAPAPQPVPPPPPLAAADPPPPAAAPPLAPPDAVVAPVPGRRGPGRLILALLALVLVIGGAIAAYLWLRTPASAPAAAPDTAAEISVIAARHTALRGNDGEALRAEAERYLKAGSHEATQGALLLYTAAYDKGNASAATAVGRMWDPEGFEPGRSAFAAPDPDKAALWYQRAAERNDPEGLYRLGHLLLSGRTQAGEGPEAGVTYLSRAAGLGHEAARAELARLKEVK